jgi:hypothetical protein
MMKKFKLSPIERMFGSGFTSSARGIDRVLQSNYGGYKIPKGKKLEKV